MRGASEKQIRFIGKLLDTRECGTLHNAPEAQAVRTGLGEELSVRQASEFIDMLLQCPEPGGFRTGATVEHKTLGIGTVVESTADMSLVEMSDGMKRFANSFLQEVR